ncbi:Low temperature viability protein-domain-containing protein [Globomyces pollinis-pini]|nr:Low temperature viability protein-domain-containing protein [Globomyces pollinis-pini]
MSNGNELNQKDMVAYDGFEKRVGTQDPSNYGVYFKNQDDYDYLQHLKPIGQDPSAVLVEPKHVKPETLGIQFKDKEDGENLDLQMKKKLNLPSSALASNQELDIGLLNQVENPLGNQIDLDPSLREILTALDDEAYVENDLEDDFFDAFHMDSMPEKYQALENQVYEEPEDVEQEPWMREFKKFQNSKQPGSDDEFSDDDFSEGTEKPYVKSRGARTATTSFSMSSSAMFRNEKLTLLDDQFDKLLEEYSDDEIGELDAEDEEVLGTLNVSGLALEETLEEKRLDEMFDDFLGNLKVIGNRRRVVTRDPSESLSAIRTELKQEAAEVVHQYSVIEDVDVVDIPMPFPEKKEKERWDCESVLTMNTNIYNRPKLIQEISKGVPKIRLRKGMPSVVPEPTSESESESASEPERRNN